MSQQTPELSKEDSTDTHPKPEAAESPTCKERQGSVNLGAQWLNLQLIWGEGLQEHTVGGPEEDQRRQEVLGRRRCPHGLSEKAERVSVCSTVWCKSESSSVKVQVPITVQPQLWDTHLNPLVKDQLKSPLVCSMYLVWATLAWWNWERGHSYSKIAWWAMDCPILDCWVERVPING